MGRTKRNPRRVLDEQDKKIVALKRDQLLKEIQRNKKLLEEIDANEANKKKKNGMFHSLLQSVGVHPKDKTLKFLKHKREYHKGHFSEFLPNSVVQSDLMELPNDKGYRYVLIIVDNVSKAIDAQPLKSKTTEEVINGFKKIFARKYIKPT